MPLSTKDPRPSPADAEAVVHAALDAGVTLIDTADAYALDGRPPQPGGDVVINPSEQLMSTTRADTPRGTATTAHSGSGGGQRERMAFRAASTSSTLSGVAFAPISPIRHTEAAYAPTPPPISMS
jgi:aldo/keto reductase family protein